MKIFRVLSFYLEYLSYWHKINDARENFLKLIVQPNNYNHSGFINKIIILNLFKDDPNERENLAGEMIEKLRELESLLEEYKKVTVDPQVKEPVQDYRDPKGDPALWGDKFSPGWC